MRHLKRTAKLGRTSEHRNAMLANLVCSLIEHKRVTTTLAKAKAARSVAEKMVTLGKKGTLHHRRLAVARLHQESAAKTLFKEIAPAFKDRRSGYTRIIRIEQRQGDAAQRAILEWVDTVVPVASAVPAAGAAPADASATPATPAAPAAAAKPETATSEAKK
jgi:large subunit ribosomal protein L17